MDKCTRNFYDKAICIRDVKLDAAELGYDELLRNIQPAAKRTDARAAVIGGGPAGISAAFFLARNGIDVTVFERQAKLGGAVRYLIPGFRIDDDVIDNDIKMMEAYGVSVKTGTEAASVDELKKAGYKYVIVCTGSWKPSPYSLEGGKAIDCLNFLAAFKADPDSLELGSDVVVIGGGNTAMDTARCAKRCSGVEKVRLVYRRTQMEMPADEEELQLALADGVEFYELLSPEALAGGRIKCRKMKLGEPDESGRRRPVGTEEFEEFPCTTAIASVGTKTDSEWFAANGIGLNERGRVKVEAETLEAGDNVFIAGDAQLGAATVVQAIAGARKAADCIVEREALEALDNYSHIAGDYMRAVAKRGILSDPQCPAKECTRCLECSTVCESCRDVCPNRANIAISVPGHSMLLASAVRSKYPRARILDIDCSAALALDGVIDVLTAEDVPNNKVGHIQQDWDVFIARGASTRSVGDAICLVVAENAAALAKAKKLVKISYEELEPVRSIKDAMAEGAPLVHSGGNLCQSRHVTRGDAAAALKNSAYKVTETFKTPFTEHAFLEPECAVAFPYKDGVKVLSTDQGAYDTRKEIAIMFGWDPERIIVENKLIGGGFGGKEDVSVQHLAALAANKLQRTVKVKLTRQESINFHPKRHAMEGTFTLGCDESGIFTGLDCDIYFDTGAYASLCGPVLERA